MSKKIKESLLEGFDDLFSEKGIPCFDTENAIFIVSIMFIIRYGFNPGITYAATSIIICNLILWILLSGIAFLHKISKK